MAQQPQLTKDRNQAHSDLDEYGYCLIGEALTPKEVETARTRLVEQAAAEGPTWPFISRWRPGAEGHR